MTSDLKNTVEASNTVQRNKIGVVESDKRDKSRTVVIRYMVKHPKYGKYVRRRTALQVHDPLNESRVGDTVEVEPCRPISKTKTWRLVRVVQRSNQVAPVQA